MRFKHSKYSTEQWDMYLPALSGLALRTLKVAKAVLVDAKKPSEVAKELGVSPQYIHGAVTRVRKVLEREVEGLVPVLVWLPPELAEEVKQMAAQYEQPKIKRED